MILKLQNELRDSFTVWAPNRLKADHDCHTYEHNGKTPSRDYYAWKLIVWPEIH